MMIFFFVVFYLSFFALVAFIWLQKTSVIPCDNGCIILSSVIRRMPFVHRFSYLLIEGQKITEQQNHHMKDVILVIKGKLPIKVCYKWLHSK